MKPRDRFFIVMAVTVIVAAAITVGVASMIGFSGGFQGPELALLMPLPLLAVVALWLLTRSGR